MTLPEKQQAIEVEKEGLVSLLGQTITVFCAVYIYTGKLMFVNSTVIRLESPKIVYETGAFDNPGWSEAESLPNDAYIMLGMIESFMLWK